ncbi:MAG: hypothetical protein AAFN79_01020 [Pseudomonadota bacterium]
MLRARAFSRQVLAMLLIAFSAGLSIGDAKAHELRPALAEISFPEGRYEIAFYVNLEALLADVGPGHDNVNDSLAVLDYLRFREMRPETVSSEYFAFESTFLNGLYIEDGEGADLERDTVSLLVPAVGDLTFARESVIKVGGPVPEGVAAVSVGWDANFGAIVVRTKEDADGEGFSAFLIGGDVSGPIPVEGASQGAVARFFNGLWRWAVTGE